MVTKMDRNIAEIIFTLKEISKKLDRRPSLDIPPLWLRKVALSFDKIKNWEQSYKILCDYYGIEPLKAVVDVIGKKVSKDAIACYIFAERTVYAKSTIDDDTGIHEFFHHLYHCAGLKYDKIPSEAMTEAYTKAFLEGVTP